MKHLHSVRNDEERHGASETLREPKYDRLAKKIAVASVLGLALSVGCTYEIAGLSPQQTTDNPDASVQKDSGADSITENNNDSGQDAMDSGSDKDGGVDAGPQKDSGPADSGLDADSGAVDSGPIDAGPVDSGIIDSGSEDSGIVDAGPVDSGPVDSGHTDSGVDSGVDSGSPCPGVTTGTVNPLTLAVNTPQNALGYSFDYTGELDGGGTIALKVSCASNPAILSANYVFSGTIKVDRKAQDNVYINITDNWDTGGFSSLAVDVTP